MKKTLVTIAVCGLVGFGTGCPPQPVPPFNATGFFVGSWTPPVEDTKGLGCPISMEIDHNIEQGFPQNLGMEVSVTLDLSCHPDAQALAEAGLDETMFLFMRGAVDTRGQFILATPPCEEDPCVGALFGGEGFDEDNDGLMDTATGSIGLTVDEGETEIFVLDADFTVSRE